MKFASLGRAAAALVVVCSLTIVACRGENAVTPRRPTTAARSVSYAGYTGTALTVDLLLDDSTGFQNGTAPYTTTSYSRTLTAHVSGGSGGPYKYVWYHKLCTRMFNPTRNVCDQQAMQSSATGPSITIYFGRWDWASEYSVQVQDAALTGSEAGKGFTHFDGPNDPYEGGTTQMSCWSNSYGLSHDHAITTSGTPISGPFRFNICDGSIETAP